MPKSVFISHSFRDRSYAQKIKKWETKELLGNVTITMETKDVRPDGPPGIKKHINPYLRGAAAILVLVGDDTHNKNWVHHEIQFGKSHGKQILAMRVPDTTGALPPIINKLRILPFDPNSLKKALE